MLHLPFLTFALGGGSLSATIVGVLSLVLFGLVGVIAGPNLSKFDSDAQLANNYPNYQINFLHKKSNIGSLFRKLSSLIKHSIPLSAFHLVEFVFFTQINHSERKFSIKISKSQLFQKNKNLQKHEKRKTWHKKNLYLI